MKCKKCKHDMYFFRPVFESSNLEELSYYLCEKCKSRINYRDSLIGDSE
jgi:DNA-directed RNA polymerase subunit RPC12/RpoP